MHILLVSQYFWPESFIINDLVKELSDQGNTVTVLTGKPNYPDGNIFPGYQQNGVLEETFKGSIRVLRVPVRPRKTGTLNLVRNYLSFVNSGLRNFPRLVRNIQPDAILVYAPSPITTVIPALLLKRQKQAHLALWIQDLWPESLSATGYIRNTALLYIVSLLVRAIYSLCDTLLIQSQAFAEPVSRYAVKDKIIFYPNSIADISPDALTIAKDPISGELTNILENHFCAVFAGNLGSAQALETLLDSADKLRDLRDFRLVLVGSGSRLDWVREQCKKRNLTNVILPGRFPASTMPTIFKKADVLLVSLKKEVIFSYTVPSKIQAYMAAGKPLIAALDGEGARIVDEAQAGFSCPAEDSMALARRLRELYAMPAKQRERMGQAGRRYFLEHFEISKLAMRLTDILHARISGKEI